MISAALTNAIDAPAEGGMPGTPLAGHVLSPSQQTCPRRRQRGHATRIRHGRRAFTLVEILATLVLAAIILPVAMSGISLALSVADESRWQTEGAALAQNKMAEIMACSLWSNSSLSGDFSPDQPEYRWAALVHDWQGTRIRQLDVEVSWNSRGQDRHVVLSTLVYTGGDTQQ
jgi:prepilin-type N-terminal cleavage/methylation domain-containing protein